MTLEIGTNLTVVLSIAVVCAMIAWIAHTPDDKEDPDA